MDHNKAKGVCKLGSNCPKVIQDFKAHKIPPTVCGWTEFAQIVCCETLSTEVKNLSKSEKSKG